MRPMRTHVYNYTYNACPAHDPSARAMDTRARVGIHARVYIITRTEYVQKVADLATVSK